MKNIEQHFRLTQYQDNMLLLALLIAFFSSGYGSSAPSWETLRVTWGMNPSSPYVFAKMPMTETEAKNAEFVKLNDDCTGGHFLGNRYMKDQDTAAVLIYDVNGYIAGIQFGVPKSVILNVTLPYFENIPAYQLDKISSGDTYFVTAYFVDPKIICNGGRTKEQFDEGAGMGLYLQNGSDPIQDSKEIPMYEKDIRGTRWVKGQCFSSMGVHYWYDAHENVDCKTWFPFAVIYNRGKLMAFNFFVPGYHKLSERVEHPPKMALSIFFPLPLPKCVVNEYEISGGYTAMHVFFNAKQENLSC